jgi:ATP-dependent Lon protease
MPRKGEKEMKNSETSDSDSEWTPGCEDKESKKDMSTLEMQKFMQKIFPSKSGKERVKLLEEMESINKKLSSDTTNDSKSSKNKKTSKSLKTKKKALDMLKKNTKIKNDKKNISSKKQEDSSEEECKKMLADEQEQEEEEQHEYDDDEEDYDADYDDDEDMTEALKKNMKFNIVFTVDERGGLNYNEDDEYSDEEMENESEEEEEENISSDKEESKGETNKTSKKKGFELYDRVYVKDKEWDEEYIGEIVKVNSRNRYDIRLEDKDLDKRNWKMINGKYMRPCVDDGKEKEELMDELKELVNIKKKSGNNAMLQKFEQYVKQEEKRIKKKEQKEKVQITQRNTDTFKKLVTNKKKICDIKYFRKLDRDSQEKIIKELEEVNKHTYIDKPYLMALLESKIEPLFKSEALKKINILNYMDPGSSEYYKVKQWVDSFMKIPFGTNISLPVTINDEEIKYRTFMEDSKRILDETVHGLEDAKMQMMQFLGQLIVNPDSVGCAMALVGPPGTGKTTLIKDAFSKIIKRPFAMCALGGAEDGSHWKGHDYTYMESKYGRIVEILIQSKCMNPLIYFDELCKVSNSPKGEEVIGMLTHLTDTTQNNKFEDKFFSGLNFDMSKAMFVFSYNDEAKVNSVLKNRFYRITTKGYDKKDQVIIAKKHLIPKIQENIKFDDDEINIPDKTLDYIIENYTESEKGVRNLKRCLEIIFTKINLYKLMPKDSKLFDGYDAIEITKPFNVTEDIVKKLIKVEESKKIPFGLFT